MKRKPRNLASTIALSMLGITVLIGAFGVVSTPYVPPESTHEAHVFTRRTHLAPPSTPAPVVTAAPPSPENEYQQIFLETPATEAPVRQSAPKTVSVPLHGKGGVTVNLPEGTEVWLSETGHSFHKRNDCGNMNPKKAKLVTVEVALKKQKDACDNCYG